MSTQKQKKVAKLLIENISLDSPLNGGQILEKTGYAPGVVKNPSDILDSKGVQEELALAGFTEGNAKQVVSDIMLDDSVEPNARLKATDQVFKVQGSYAPEKRNVKVDISSVGDLDNAELENISAGSAK